MNKALNPDAHLRKVQILWVYVYDVRSSLSQERKETGALVGGIY